LGWQFFIDSRKVKKSEKPSGTVSRHRDLGRGVCVVFTMRCGFLRWVGGGGC